MNLKSLFSVLLFSSSLNAFAQQNDFDESKPVDKGYVYEFAIDAEKQTAFTGADLSMSMIEGYRQLDDLISPESDSSYLNALMIIPRVMITGYASTFQHEVFGHGARIREIKQGWKVRSYKVNLNGSGSTNFWHPKNPNSQHMALVDIAGMQATEVLSYKLKSRFLDSETINPTYSAAYLNSAGDQIMYTYMTDYKKSKGHDIQNYITDMNNIYGKNYLGKSKIKSRTAISLLDPFIYYSGYSLVTGKDFEYPMIQLGDLKYLPAFRAILTPYGLENKWINHFKTPSTPFQLNFIQGKNKRGTSWGGELMVDSIVEHENLKFGFNVATWNQPKLFTNTPLNAPNRQGYSGEGNLTLNLNETSAIYTSMGYKTAGFRVGYPAKSSALVRMGLAFKL